MKIDFQVDLRQIFISVLSRTADTDSKAAIKNMNEFELVSCYLNWWRRVITPQPRRLLESKELAFTRQHTAHGKQIDALLSKIENGKDVTAHLSKAILHIHIHREQPKPLSHRRRPDLDLLLNDWGIHHLHISDEMEPGGTGFVKRGGPLLFAIFMQDRAYLLDILGHKDFASDRLFQIIVGNWPHDRLIVKLGMIPGEPDTPEERMTLRSAGFTTFATIDGKAYISGLTGGMSTAGTSGRNTREAGQFLRRIMEVEAACKKPDFVRELYAAAGLPFPTNPELRLASILGGWGVVDGRSGYVLHRILPV